MHFVCDFSPFVIPALGVVRWYGVAYLAGLLIGVLLLKRWAKRGRLPLRISPELPPRTPGGKPVPAVDEVMDAAMTLFLAMLIGGRLGYCVFYQPDLLTEFSAGIPWWGVLRVNDGGMASHGGVAGMMLAWWWRYGRRGRSSLVVADAVACVMPIGIVFGRLANFINGELWGRVSDAAWAVIFPYAARHLPGQSAAEAYAFQIAQGIANPARHPSQLYAVVLEGLIPAAICLYVHARHRRPGLTMGLIFTLYAIGRIIGEGFREPDLGQPGGLISLGSSERVPAILGLFSKGQFFSLPLLVFGLACIAWAMSRPRRPEAYAAPVQTAEAPSATPHKDS